VLDRSHPPPGTVRSTTATRDRPISPAARDGPVDHG
jgi:hypothetical protein